jgi:hypothetical protein
MTGSTDSRTSSATIWPQTLPSLPDTTESTHYPAQSQAPTAPTIPSSHVDNSTHTGAGSERTDGNSSGLSATSKGTTSSASHHTDIVNPSSAQPPPGSASLDWWELRITCYMGQDALRECGRQFPRNPPEFQSLPTVVLWRVDFKGFPEESLKGSKRATIKTAHQKAEQRFPVAKRKPRLAPGEGYDVRRAWETLIFRVCPESLLDSGTMETKNGEVAFDRLLMEGSKSGGGIQNVIRYLPFGETTKNAPAWKGTLQAMTASMAGKAMAVRAERREAERREAERAERAKIRDIWLS